MVSSVLQSAKAGLTTCGGTEGCLPPPLPPPAPGCCRFPNIFHSRVLPGPDCGVWRPRWSLYLRVITKYVLCPAARITAKRHHRHQLISWISEEIPEAIPPSQFTVDSPGTTPVGAGHVIVAMRGDLPMYNLYSYLSLRACCCDL